MEAAVSREPIWHQPCFVELLGAGELLPPQAAASPRANSFAEPLSLAAELLEQVLLAEETMLVFAVNLHVSMRSNSSAILL